MFVSTAVNILAYINLQSLKFTWKYCENLLERSLIKAYR